MPQILNIEQIPKTSQPWELECLLHGCGELAHKQVLIQDGYALLKPCLCDGHATLSADEIIAALDRHKRVFRCPRHGVPPDDCGCDVVAKEILQETNNDRPLDP